MFYPQLTYLHPKAKFVNALLVRGFSMAGLNFGALLVSKPTETAQNEELPVIPSHTNILNRLVDDFRFYCGVEMLAKAAI